MSVLNKITVGSTQYDIEDATAAKASSLATVATSGSYDDLDDKPTIPAAQIQADWDQSDNTAKDFIKSKPTLGTAAAKDSTNNVTAGSTDLVESGAVKTAIDTAIASVGGGIKPLEFDSEVAIYDATGKYLKDAEGTDIDITGVISDWANVKGFIFVTEDKSEVATLDKIKNKVSVTYDDSVPTQAANNNTTKVVTHIIMKHPDSELLRFGIANGIYGDRNVSEYFLVRVTSDGTYTIGVPRHPKEDSDSDTDIRWEVFKIFGVYLIY